MFLINKTNDDWWNVRKANGEEGFVPANYVRESEPKKINVRVKKEVKVPEKKMVPRVRMVKKTERIKRRKPKAPRKWIVVVNIDIFHLLYFIDDGMHFAEGIMFI